MFNRILVPLDGSDLAETVLSYVQELAPKVGAEVLLVRAVPTLAHLVTLGSAGGADLAGGGVMADAELANEAYEAERRAAESYLKEVRARLERDGLRTGMQMVEGAPADSIIELASPGTLIAMCTHGRGGLGRLVLGSVADEVLRNVHVPVLLIRHADEAVEEVAA